ncbi:2-oxoglutarate ferredoxin oxidoreductase subunit alpha [Thermanaeromonas toyohensis ToBE]|uniref:2-oxoglutarate ferredoxin oxidoreductase subunit alpha n=1 Tax=Thermanaeromonas toyohensis ToBE TaxID=698762 RepID=A0A1W1VPH7_9FIRM|nr:3-methyl-2-oxobutanoate dehydrogenase subunit VorB [Thermanaeromonas toyohensis]SMB95258.1 2-oxoglutarate ferredoxin oxidoreductase subunit alpha [Thermanaeromonas toyohensis ToBE]
MECLQLVKGNEALAEAAILAGCRFFAGYPITPQNEILEYMAWRLPQVGGSFVQAESELAAINMVFGAAGAGARAMTASSGPGISLMQEGISYLAAAELPAVIANMARGGPGLGGIQAAQGDYFQATKGGGHGDYRVIVLAPASIQEMVDITFTAFELADRYRNPVMILADAILGQAMEPVRLKDPGTQETSDFKPWATTGWEGNRPRNVIYTLYLEPEALEGLNLRLQRKYAEICQKEKRWEAVGLADAQVALVAYGTASRICRRIVEVTKQQGLRVALIRPITLWPFPSEAFEEALAAGITKFLVVEMNYGQMVEDVRLAVNGRGKVAFYGRGGGMIPTPKEIIAALQKLIQEG